MRSSKTVGQALAGEGPKRKARAAVASGTSKKTAAGAASAPRPRRKGVVAAAPADEPQTPDQNAVDRMVAEAAYYLAEKRAFAPGFEEQDWQAAKDQIAVQLRSARNPLGPAGQ